MSAIGLACAVATVGGLGIVPLMIYMEQRKYRYDDRNPYRRYCKLCHQQQNNFSHSYHETGWWEPVGTIKNENCKCHKDCQ